MKHRNTIVELSWDSWNLVHIAKHGVTREMVETVLTGRFVIRDSYKERQLIIGEAPGDRIMAIIVGEEPGNPGTYYVFSARPASRKERAIFALEKGPHE